MHKALERLHRRALHGKDISERTAPSVWSELWNPPASWTEKRANEMRETGLEYLRQYVQRYGDRFRRVRWVEEPIELPVTVDERRGLLVTGRLDLACESERGVEVIDFKVRSRKGLDVIRSDYQVKTYGAAVQNRNHTVDRVSLHLLAEEPGQDVVTYEWDERASGETWQLLRTAAEGILDKRFDATPGPHCEFCDFRQLCPASTAREQRDELEEETPDAIPISVAG